MNTPARPVVLVVDDVPDVVTSMSLLLEAEGFEVLGAESVPTALNILVARRVDVIVADVHIPGKLDGVDLVALVARFSAPRPRIVAMSGAPNLSWHLGLRTARTVGADATFIKSLDPQLLVRRIRQLLHLPAVGSSASSEW